MATTTVPGPFSRFAFGRPVAYEREGTRVASRPLTALVARVFLGSLFLAAGIGKLADPAGTVAYMNQHGVPAADTLVYIAGLAEIAGGASIITGFLTRIGALGLVCMLAIITYYFHDFWNLAGAEREAQQVQFFKNLAIAGGLLLVVANGAARYSLDALLSRRVAGVPRSS